MAGRGRLVLVVGPSGAGKDTLIAGARTALGSDPRFVFLRRVVTRPAQADAEDHESVSPETFALQEQQGAYALSWEAHGLSYGLPVELLRHVAAGRIVVANGSRAMVAKAMARYPGTRVVLIDAAPEVRAHRLGLRGRETPAEIAGRLERDISAVPPSAIAIVNSGTPAAGIGRFVAALRAIAED